MMMRAVHRLEIVGTIIHRHWRIHTITVVRQMTGRQVELVFGEMRRAHTVVSVALLRFLGEFFNFIANDRAVRQPDRQSFAHALVNKEQLLFLPAFSVVALLGECPALEILLNLSLVREGPTEIALRLGILS